MKIVDASFDSRDPLELAGIINGAKSVKDLFDNKFHEVVKWIIVDTEQENRRPVLYIVTETGGSYYTTGGDLIKKLQDYTLKAEAGKRKLPKARFYEGTGKTTGNKFFGIYFEEQM